MLSLNRSSPSNLSNTELETALKIKTTDERKLTLEIIALLEEVDRRKLHLEKGYGSLLAYCVKELKYSESSAYRRISAMRVVREVPAVKKDIEAGSLNLVTVAQAHTFFRAEAKTAYTTKPLSPDQKKEIFTQLQNKSAREAEKLFATLSPDYLTPTKEKVRSLTESKTQVTLVIDDNLMQKLEALKNLLSHSCPSGKYVDLIEYMANQTLKKLEGATSSRTATPALVLHDGNDATEKSKAPPQTKRLQIQNPGEKSPPLRATPRPHLPISIKRKVWAKYQGQCCYHNAKTNQRCSSRKFLEIDHIHPIAHAGVSCIDNLQLLCDAHNRWKGAQLL